MLNKIKTFFLWLFVLVGLVLVLIGAVESINLGLKTYVFPKANEGWCARPVPIKMKERPTEVIENEEDNYKMCLEQQSAQRQRDAAQALAFLAVGLPTLAFFYRKTKNGAA